MLNGGVDFADVRWWQDEFVFIEGLFWITAFFFIWNQIIPKVVKSKEPAIFWPGRLTIFAIFGAIIVYRFHQPQSAGEWGDFVGGFFAVPALIWFIAAVFLQRQELSAQRQSLEAQLKELELQRIEHKKNVIEQEKIAKSLNTSARKDIQTLLISMREDLKNNMKDFMNDLRFFIIRMYKGKLKYDVKYTVKSTSFNYDIKEKLLTLELIIKGEDKLSIIDYDSIHFSVFDKENNYINDSVHEYMKSNIKLDIPIILDLMKDGISRSEFIHNLSDRFLYERRNFHLKKIDEAYWIDFILDYIETHNLHK